jgi:hypothetical protein
MISLGVSFRKRDLNFVRHGAILRMKDRSTYCIPANRPSFFFVILNLTTDSSFSSGHER